MKLQHSLPEKDDTRMQGEPARGVEVLLATYNGERFLREQIESILAQEYADLTILARDDGSSDGTEALLAEYAVRDPRRMRLVVDGERSGSAQANFLRLLRASSAPYVCLSDQDDVWLPHKISACMRAMQHMEAEHGVAAPLLVFSDLRVVDERLQPLHASFWRHERVDPSSIHRLRSMLHQNMLTGCTAMLNRALVELVLTMPEEASMHDRWIALVAAALGHSTSLPEPMVLYRQHAANVVGASREAASVASVARRAKDAGGRVAEWETSQRMARALLRLHGGAMREVDRRLVETFLRCGTSSSRMVRVGIFLRYRFFRSGWLRNAATVVMLWQLRAAVRDERGDAAG
jgi:glycosyltransferase involved in cell wall biosynthesis